MKAEPLAHRSFCRCVLTIQGICECLLSLFCLLLGLLTALFNLLTLHKNLEFLEGGIWFCTKDVCLVVAIKDSKLKKKCKITGYA